MDDKLARIRLNDVLGLIDQWGGLYERRWGHRPPDYQEQPGLDLDVKEGIDKVRARTRLAHDVIEAIGEAAPDSGAVDGCIATLARLQVPATAGAPAARTALRGNGFRYSNAVVAAAVKRRKGLSAAATDADDEEFEVVVR